MTPADRARRLLHPTPIAVLLLFALTAAAYWPGLHGGFLFDDIGNLDALGYYGGVRDLNSFLYFLSASEADPTGRPVAQLSFLLDARNWPADPFPFKRTNLLLHLVNGTLLLWLLLRLEARTGQRSGIAAGPSRWIALLTASLWVTHPLWVSTTLYIVQRQAMLAATFCLLGLLAWDRAYTRWSVGQRLRGWGWAVFGLGGTTVLAGLSKANGFLTPLLALVLWWTWYLPPPVDLPAIRRRTLRRDGWLVAGLPSLALLAYLALQVPSATGRAVAVRGWTLGERMLSEPRALFEYLSLLIAPREGSGGVFNDGFVASRGLFDPLTTLPAFLGIVMLIMLGFASRWRWPRLSTALLFFFAGHLIESGPVPLELYFEHRNYLPALLLAWPAAAALLAPGKAGRLRAGLAIVVLTVWLLLTWQRAQVWGNPPLQAALWAQRNPQSPRAQSYAADWLIRQGHLAEARALLAKAEKRVPNQTEITLNRVAESCTSGILSEPALRAAEASLRARPLWNQGMQRWLERIESVVLQGQCPAVGRKGLQRLFAATEDNPAYMRSPGRRQAMLRLRGRLALADGDPQLALRLFDHGLDIDPRPQTALAQAADLGNAGYPFLGVRHLDHYVTLDVNYAPGHIRTMADIHRWLLVRTGYYPHEMTLLRRALAADANAHGRDSAMGKHEGESKVRRIPAEASSRVR